jgi:uncharacterized protein YjlB
MTPPTPLTFLFKDDGAVPNNPVLPALVYKGAVDSGGRDPARAIEDLFARNGWGHGQWRNGIYTFAHYHSMIHEALGIARGTARVQLGGPGGETFDFAPGDVAVLPAGTGHQRLSGSADLLVIGAYPPEGTYNLLTFAVPTTRPTATRPSRRSRRCRCRRAIRCSARTAG